MKDLYRSWAALDNEKNILRVFFWLFRIAHTTTIE